MNQPQTPLKENKMGVMPIPRLIFTMSLPMVLSMLSQALYNIVDSIFVAQVGEYALTAVSLAFPIQNLMIAFATGTGVGINAFLSMKLGQRDFKSVNKTAANAVFLTACTYVVFLIAGLFFIPAYYNTQTNDALIFQHSVDYTRICVFAGFGLFGVITANRLLQATGKTLYVMITQMSGVLINIVLDPILIFGLFGLPRMETAGAAWATVIGQVVSLFIGIYFNKKHNKEIQCSLKGFRPNPHIISRIYVVGLPSILMVGIGSVMTYGFNLILVGFSSTAVAVFGVYFKLMSFATMPTLGLNNGLIPIVAYNYGAGNKQRVQSAIKVSTIVALCIMITAIIIFQAFPRELLQMFNASEEMITIGIPALRILSLQFIGAGFCITFSSVFQALGNGVLSLIMAIVRQLAFMLPSAWLLAQTGVLENVWWSFPIAEIASLALAIVFLIHINKKVISNIAKVEQNI